MDGLNGSKIAWTGEVHGLFVNDDSEMLEDTDADGRMESTDARVVIYYDATARDSRACYGTVLNGTCSGTSKNIRDIKYLWSASGWLNSIVDADILSNRSPYLSNAKKRYIFTWNDLNNDGIVDTATEMLPFVDANGATAVNWSTMSVASSRGSVALDFGVPGNDDIRKVIRWVRGQDQTGMRSRQVAVDTNNDGVYDTTKDLAARGRDPFDAGPGLASHRGLSHRLP